MAQHAHHSSSQGSAGLSPRSPAASGLDLPSLCPGLLGYSPVSRQAGCALPSAFLLPAPCTWELLISPTAHPENLNAAVASFWKSSLTPPLLWPRGRSPHEIPKGPGPPATRVYLLPWLLPQRTQA